MTAFGFRWYGPEAAVTLEHIRQIPPVTELVTSLYHIPAGALWPEEDIAARAARAAAAGLHFSVAEGLPVHESIYLGGKYHIKKGEQPLPDGSATLAFHQAALERMNPERDVWTLPGWNFSTRQGEIRTLLGQYRALGEAGLWNNLRYFLQAVAPEAERLGIRLAIHPDDPPLPVFGLPRVVSTLEDLLRLTGAVDLPSNGVTLCTGSLGSSRANDVVKIADRLCAEGKIPFVHGRNVRWEGEEDFCESGHLTASGSLNMAAILAALHRRGFDGVIRADHGRMVWGERGRPGYGLYDRAMGVCYLAGLWEALCYSC